MPGCSTRTCLAWSACGLLIAASFGCAQEREPKASIPPGEAARFGLSSDAADPTQRDLDAGYYRWEEKPEPEGTRSQHDPARRQVGAPPP